MREILRFSYIAIPYTMLLLLVIDVAIEIVTSSSGRHVYVVSYTSQGGKAGIG